MATAEKVFHRVRALGDSEKMEDDGKIRLLASTHDAVDWGGWREVLKHEPGSIDMGSARSLLINHKADLLAGGISGMEIANGELSSNAEIDEDVRMPSGMSVRKAVKKRYLGGVSVGYTYEMKDTQYDEDTRTLTVNKWRLLEISLTPIPADGRAQVRSLPDGIEKPTTAAPAASQERTFAMSDVIKPQDKPVDPIVDETARAREMADLRERAVKAEREVKLRALASEHGVSTEGMDFGSFKDEAAGLTALLKRKAEKDETRKPDTAITSIRVDAVDKASDAVMGALALNAGFKNPKIQDGNPLAGRGMQDIIRGHAEMVGENTRGWSKHDVAYYALGKPEKMSRSAANVTSSNFTSFVMLNAVTKITAMGFERGSATARYKDIVSTQIVPDFKSFSIGALGSGNLTNTNEDIALPELTKTDGAYSSTAKTWGGTVSLTLQALVNDDTGAFNRVLSQAGVLLDKTIDRRTFQKLLMGTSSAEGTSTWTSNTTSGGTLVYTTQDLMAAARAKLGLVRTALQVKVGLDGNPMGNIPKFLICGPTREMEAQGICGVSGPGLQAGAQQSAVSMQVISSAWLEASALTGYSTTTYYLLCDPNEVTGLVLSKVQGYEGVNVEQYDAGAVLAMKWKLWSPFEVDLFYAGNSAGTATIPAAQQGTT